MCTGAGAGDDAIFHVYGHGGPVYRGAIVAIVGFELHEVLIDPGDGGLAIELDAANAIEEGDVKDCVWGGHFINGLMAQCRRVN